MGRFFNLESPAMIFLGRLADLLWLNILYIICCIPIITIGAATTSLYYITMKMVADEEGYITKSFFKAFKDNFIKATIVWLLAIAAFVIMIIDFIIIFSMEETVGKIVFVILCMVCVIYVMVMIYIFPLLAKFENKIRHSLKNALLISIRHFPMTLLLLVEIVAPFLLIYFIIELTPALFLIVFSLIAFCTSYTYRKIFNYYIPQEDEEVEE